MIEDDLAAPPVRLRREIRRLRALLLVNADALPSNRDQAISVMANHLCMLRDEPGAGCACPGICRQHAEKIMNDLETKGFAVVKLEKCG